MKYVKYNSVPSGQLATGQGGTANAGASSDTRGGEQMRINRLLWGNEDQGGPINDSIYCSGSIYLSQSGDSDVGWDSDDPDDNGYEGGYDWDDEINEEDEDYVSPYPVRDGDNGGNIYTDGYIECGSFYTKDGYSKVVWFDRNNTKTNLADDQQKQDAILANHETRITENERQIALLRGGCTCDMSTIERRLSDCEQDIDGLESRVSTLERGGGSNPGSGDIWHYVDDEIQQLRDDLYQEIQADQQKIADLQKHVQTVGLLFSSTGIYDDSNLKNVYICDGHETTNGDLYVTLMGDFKIGTTVTIVCSGTDTRVFLSADEGRSIIRNGIGSGVLLGRDTGIYSVTMVNYGHSWYCI